MSAPAASATSCLVRKLQSGLPVEESAASPAAVARVPDRDSPDPTCGSYHATFPVDIDARRICFGGSLGAFLELAPMKPHPAFDSPPHFKKIPQFVEPLLHSDDRIEGRGPPVRGPENRRGRSWYLFRRFVEQRYRRPDINVRLDRIGAQLLLHCRFDGLQFFAGFAPFTL